MKPLHFGCFMTCHESKTYVKNILIVFFVLLSYTLFSQGTLEDINKGWEDVTKYEKLDDPVGVLRTLVQMEEQMTGLKEMTNEVSRSLWRINGYQLPMDTLETLLDSTDLLLSKAYKLDGIWNMRGDIEFAKSQLLKSLSIGKLHSEFHRPARWLGYIYSLQDDMENAKSIYEDAILAANNFYKKDTNEKDRFLSVIHIGLAHVHQIRGDYKSTREHATEVMVLGKKLKSDYYLGYGLLQTIKLMNRLKEHKAALQLIEKNNDFIDKLDNSGRDGFYSAKAISLMGLGRYDEALDIGLNTNLSGSVLTNSYKKMRNADCYLHLGQFEKALNCYDELVKIYLENPSSNRLAISYFLRAKTNQELGRLDDAKKDLAEGLKLEDIRSDMKISYYPLLASIYIDDFEKSDDLASLDSAQLVLSITDSLINELILERRYFEDNLNVGREIYDVYATKINVMSRLYKINPTLVEQEKLFSYFENLKANSLREQLKTDNAVIIGQVPETVLDTEKEFQLNITNLKHKIYNLDSDDQTDDQLIALQEKVNLEKEGYYSFLKALEKDYPGYYKHEYSTKLVSLDELQAQLSDDVLLEYFVSDDYIFSLLITSNSYQLFQKEKPENWEEKIEEFQGIIHDPESSTAEFSELSNLFYKLLIQEQAESIPPDISKLRIIPDDLINFIPFEVLIANDSAVSDFRKFPYLLNRFNISYSQSANLLVDLLKKGNSKSRLNYAGFAPKYENIVSDSLSKLIAMNTRGEHLDLPFARESVDRVSKLMNGKTYINNSATKSSFLNNAPDAKVIHLAMHGFIDLEKPSFSSLLFFGEEPEANLFSSEVYGLELNSDLAVLSACNTGVGKLVNGDGIQNMSRAFGFAGVKNTIMSLWSVPDIQTSQINYEFFQNIKQELPIDEALTKSKLTYLENSTLLRAHPYYWAGMVANGSMEPIQFSDMSFNWPILLFGGILLLVSALFLSHFLKNKSLSQN